MENIKLNISKLKQIVTKMNLAIEKSKINPKAGWIEIKSEENNTMSVKVSNYDYYFEASIPIEAEDNVENGFIHATINSDTFVPLVSKLDDSIVSINQLQNSLILHTESSEYTFPLIKERGEIRKVDTIEFNCPSIESIMSGKDISSVAESNAKGLLDSTFSKEIQQYVYMDNVGAITFTENIYINTFSEPVDNDFKFLLNATQSKLLKVFGDCRNVNVLVETDVNYESPFKVKFESDGDIRVALTLVVQSPRITDKFPSIRLRELSQAVSKTHAVINKKDFEKALSRLMVFDKKFDITVLNYSKLVFEEEGVKLVSIKNQNYEYVPYKSHVNTVNHESIIRFADLVNQLKAINSNEIDVSYGDSPAIVLNTDILKQLIPEIRAIERT